MEESSTPTLMSGKPEVSLYFHIPFCSKKCDYCHFYVLPNRETDRDLLLNGFWLEWQNIKNVLSDKELVSVYFGGGTPSLIGPQAIEKILTWILPNSSTEITLEANPENVDLNLMKGFKAAGVNRISLGAQSFDDHLLKSLGRTHSALKVRQAVEDTFNSGIKNVSIDLMYDIPGQNLEQWRKTLFSAAALPITHLSLYNLTFEPNTLFYKRQNSLKKLVPDPDTSLLMYELAIESLEFNKFFQYEISAFAKNDLQSKHNLGYWTGRPFLGLGPSAFSYWEGKRFRNVAHLGKYVKFLKEGRSTIDFDEQLEREAAKRELLAVRLRLKEGVDLTRFKEMYGNLESEVHKVLGSLIEQGFVEQEGEVIKLSKKGILFYDTVASEII